MRHLFKLLFIITLTSIWGVATYADNANPTEGKDVKPIVLRPKHPINHRHNAPSRQQVSCVYYDGTLTFEFAIPEGKCQLILSDLSTGEIVAADFDSAMSEPIYIGYHSTASLTVTTANGHTYTGEW